MRNRALSASVLRAQQLIIEQCHVTNDCLDVNTRNFKFGSPPRKGVAPGNLYKRTGAIGSATFSSSIVSVTVAARNSRPASVAINHRTQLPLLFISPLGFAPRFRPSASLAPRAHLTCHGYCQINCNIVLFLLFQMNFAWGLKIRNWHPPIFVCLPSCVECNTLNCPVLRQYQHSEGRNRGAKCWNSRKNSNPFSPLGKSTVALAPTPRIFATLCQVSPLGANSF